MAGSCHQRRVQRDRLDSASPYAHQTNAVYGAMLPQPLLRFLLADEPGTGKTIMAGLYLREMQRLGLVQRALVVCPARLATKWEADFARFFGGGLRRITRTRSGRTRSARTTCGSSPLELAAVNPAVQEAIRPDRAGWDLVVFDEAHRLTPTAADLPPGRRLLAKNTPRALLDDGHAAPGQGVAVPAPAAPGRSRGLPRPRRRSERDALPRYARDRSISCAA